LSIERQKSAARDYVSDMDRALSQDLGAEAAAMMQSLEHGMTCQPLQVVTGFA
jgi:hypothetical protein